VEGAVHQAFRDQSLRYSASCEALRDAQEKEMNGFARLPRPVTARRLDLPMRERQQLLQVAFPHRSDCMRAAATGYGTQRDNDSTTLGDAGDLAFKDA